ncbi:MAG TPA: DUF58 domain-containing protein [Thermoanaerobaculia bacterium]
MPAVRCFQLLGLATLLLVASFLDERLAWAVLALDLGVVLAALVDFRSAVRTPLTASRRWPPLLVQEAPAEVAVTLESAAAGARRPVTAILREGLHPGLAAGPLRRTVEVRGELRWDYTLIPRRRGEHAAGPLTARVLGPWKLAWAQRDLLRPESVRVYPQVRWEGEVGQLLALAQRRRMGQIPQRLHGVGTEPYALRLYLPGDPIAKIHWKSTARHGRPVTREDTWERSARLVILLDCARAMASMDGRRSKLDYAVAATLALTRVAAARGDQVTIVAFADRVLRTVRVRSGGRGAALAYASLYDLEARLAEPAYDLAAEATFAVEPRSATAVLFTSVVDLAAAELLRESLLRLGRRHRALLLNLEDPELRALAADPPATPAAAFAQVASLGVQLANRRLSRHLRRGGVRVVNTPADRLALEALEAYLSIFRGTAASARAHP